MRRRAVRLQPIHLLRYGLPGGMAIAGIVLMALGGTKHTVESAIGLTALCIALFVWLTNVFARMTLVSQRDRQLEALARERYSRSGGWADPETLAAMGPAATPPRRAKPAPPSPEPEPEHLVTPSPEREPEHLARPSPAPQRPSRPYGAPQRVRSRGGGAGPGRGRRPG